MDLNHDFSEGNQLDLFEGEFCVVPLLPLFYCMKALGWMGSIWNELKGRILLTMWNFRVLFWWDGRVLSYTMGMESGVFGDIPWREGVDIGKKGDVKSKDSMSLRYCIYNYV